MEDTDKEEHDRPKAPNMLVIWLVWLFFSLVVIALSWPKVHQAVIDSGVLAYLELRGAEQQSSTNQRVVNVCFVHYPQTYTFFTQRQNRLGGSVYHDTFENLIAGPNEQALRSGAVSYISVGTKLRGLTLSNKVLYVDMSSEFTRSSNLAMAMEQLKQTATHFSGIKDIVVLVEGKVFNPEVN